MPNNETQHELTVFSAVDLPDSVARQVMKLLRDYQPDIYTRQCDANGYTS